MKKILFSIVSMVFCAALIFPVGASAQTEQPDQKKVMYNFINEYGFFIGKNVGFTSVFVNGVKINNSDAFGIGIGYGVNTASYQEVPLFVNYRHYFNRGRKLVPHINIAVGTAVNLWDEQLSARIPIYVGDIVDHYEYVQDVYHRHGFGLYSTVASGFTVKAFSFTAGLFFRTFPREKEFGGGIEVKVGYTF